MVDPRLKVPQNAESEKIKINFGPPEEDKDAILLGADVKDEEIMQFGMTTGLKDEYHEMGRKRNAL